jgi:DNA-directed RNA polymerase specialized sigma24 family protein
MRCREVEALWDEIRDGASTLREAVHKHLRAAATLRFIEGRSHPEIAEILDQPIGTVKSHVHRAVRILRRSLGPQIGKIVPEGANVHALS